MTALESFAKAHHLKVKTANGETTIPGRQGEIYERDEDAGQLAVMFLPGDHRARTWGNLRRAGEAAGMRTVQNGDAEGCLEFDHKIKAQVKLAIKIAKVRPKMKRTPEQIARFLTATKHKQFEAEALAKQREHPPDQQ